MPKAKKAPQKRLTAKQVAQMMNEWHNKTADSFAEEFGVSVSTVANMAKAVRDETKGKYCPPKGGARKNTVLAALNLVSKETPEEPE